jgi:ergothioneine biosynthesis protein EgtB
MRVPEAASAFRLAQRYEAVRQATVLLAAPLSAEDACVQSMPDASPAKWHLAHTTWFFETFVLDGEPPFDADFRVLFNSYYQQVGARHPRAQRGLLTRPSLARVLAYREAVDQRVLRWLDACGGQPTPCLAGLLELGLQHEQQHQELLLTDVKHLLSCHPLWPAYRVLDEAEGPADAGMDPPDTRWLTVPRGVHAIGHEGPGFAFDNERPRHGVYLQGCEIARHPVGNAQFLRFVEEGGYAQPQWWLAEGWDWCCAQQLAHPWYWRRDDAGRWWEFSLHGAVPLRGGRPVAHVSYFEADAYARWAGARLPTEAEWEVAFAAAMAEAGAGSQARAEPGPCLHPQPVEEAGGAPGQVWEWTQSSYAPYPGFRVAEGAVGEYNGKFMVNQQVLRGGSCLTPAGHARASYRNFFPTSARWQMTGLRLARDLD